MPEGDTIHKLAAYLRTILAGNSLHDRAVAQAHVAACAMLDMKPGETSDDDAREIASELGISARTVEVYKARAMEKLGIRRLPDLVRLVMRAQGIVE